MNKRLLITFFSVVALQSAGATILLQDSFPTNGALVGTTPSVGGIWTTISGTTPGLTVAGGTLGISASQGQNATSQFVGAQAGTIYAGFDFTLTTSPTASTSGSYVAGFRDGTAGSGSFVGRLIVQRSPGQSPDQFQLGISDFTTGVDGTGAATWGSILSLSTSLITLFSGLRLRVTI